MAMIWLKAPPGTDECNFGTQRYPVYDDGTVFVPEEAVASLTAVAGFTLVEKDPEPTPSLGSIKMQALPDQTACSWRDQVFEADAQGVITVPVEAVADLIPHGFRIVDEG